MSTDPIIADFPPIDGHDYECQCARCGSSCEYVRCEMCGGEGLDGHDCGEDICCCLHPEDNVDCDTCKGHGGWYQCLSTAAFCEGNPSPGRAHIKRGQIEWYLDPYATHPNDPTQGVSP